MKKILVTFLIAMGTLSLHAQVGLNTDVPKSTLDVMAKNTDGTTPEGLLTPRLTGDEIAAGEAQYGADQEGTLIYATAPVTTATFKTGNITKPGYYYFDGNIWQAMMSGNAVSSGTPFLLSATATDAGSDKTDAIGRTGIVGIGTTTPYAGSILDVSSTDKGLLVPRVSSTASVLTPVNGMMVYDQSVKCFKFYEKNDKWTDCLSAGAEQTVKTDCTSTDVGFMGCFTQGVAVTSANTFVVRIVNNTLNQVTLTGFTGANLVLSGASAGITVNSTVVSSPASGVMAANGGILTLTFSFGGTPTSTGTLVGSFARGVLTCGDTTGVNVGAAIAINPTPASLPAGCAYPFTSSHSGVTWSSTLPSIATVDPITGNVTAVAPGTTIIRASMCGGVTAERTVTVVTRIYTISTTGAGTLAIPNSSSGITSFVAEAYGSGGGGSGRRSNTYLYPGNGGGGGSYAQKTYAITSGNISYYVGFRGSGGSGNNVSGGNGQDSSVTYDSQTMTAGGGKGGCRVASNGNICGGQGGVATGGDTNLNGYSTTSYAGAGAAGPIGGAWQYNYSGWNGLQGNAPGGGGSSTNTTQTGAQLPTTTTGGNGQNGRVIITLVCP